MMRWAERILSVGLLLTVAAGADARSLRATSLSLFDRGCAKAFITGDATADEATVLTGTGAGLYHGLSYDDTKVTLQYNQGGEWAISTGDLLVACFNPPNGRAGTFWFDWSGSFDAGTTQTGYIGFYYSSNGESYDAGEADTSVLRAIRYGGAWGFTEAHSTGYQEVSSGDCVGLTAGNFAANHTLNLQGWALRITQLSCRDDGS